MLRQTFGTGARFDSAATGEFRKYWVFCDDRFAGGDQVVFAYVAGWFVVCDAAFVDRFFCKMFVEDCIC